MALDYLIEATSDMANLVRGGITVIRHAIWGLTFPLPSVRSPIIC